MPEHTPAPTPIRAVYGFVLHLCSVILFFLFVLWAIIPESWISALNLTCLPQKYWAVAIPIFLLTILATFAFIIYPSLNLCMTPNIDDIRTVKETSPKRRKITVDKKNMNEEKFSDKCCCLVTEKCHVNEFIALNKNTIKYSVPMVEDLCIAQVSRTLYLKKTL